MAENTEQLSGTRKDRRNMDYLIAGIPAWCVFGAATTGSLLSGLMLSLGFSPKQIGYAMSLTLIFLPMQLVGSLLQPRMFDRKKFWFSLGLFCYTMFGAIGILAWFWGKLPFAAGFTVFMLLFGIYHMLIQMTGAVVLAWKGEVVPPRESNTFWTRSTCMSTVGMIVCGILLGYLADRLGRDRSSTYAILIAFGVIGGDLSLFFQARVPDPRSASRRDLPKIAPLLRGVFAEKNFRGLAFSFSIQMFGNWMMCGLVFVYMQQTMGFSQLAIQILLAISAGVSFLTGFFFKFAGNRYGRKPLLIICTAVKVLEFLLWGLLAAGNHLFDEAGLRLLDVMQIPTSSIPAGFISALPPIILGGFVNTGIAATQLSLLTSTGKRENKGVLIALFYTVVGIVGAAASCLSGELSALFSHWDTLARTGLTPFNLLSLIGGAFYLISIIPIARIVETGAAPTVAVVKNLLAHNPFRAIYYAYVLETPLNEARRATVIRGASSNLLEDKLISALHSPSSMVRESALWNIDRNGEKLSEPLEKELIALLSDTRTGLRYPAATLLGKHRSAAALPALLQSARENKNSDFAAVCLIAAGTIRAPESVAPLYDFLRDRSGRDFWPMAAEALSRVGGFEHADAMFQAYENETDWMLSQQCLIAICRVLTDRPDELQEWFEAEYARSGSSVEILLERIGRLLRKKEFRIRSLALFESGRMAYLLERLLRAELPRFGLNAPDSLSELSLTGSHFRDPGLDKALTREAESLRIQLKLWNYLVYEGDRPDHTKLLAALILAEDFLRSTDR